MMMYDDLIKQLRYCADATTCRNCFWKTECCPTDMQKKAADALIADLKRQCKEVFRIDAVSPDDFWITRNEAYNERLWTTWCESLYDYINAAQTVIPAEEDDR